MDKKVEPSMLRGCLYLWDPRTRKSIELSTHFSFIIFKDTQGISSKIMVEILFVFSIWFEIPPTFSWLISIYLFYTIINESPRNQIVVAVLEDILEMAVWDFEAEDCCKANFESTWKMEWERSLVTAKTDEV